jgi:hypothetical protein
MRPDPIMTIRRLKRRLTCFDRALKLARRPRRIGHTAQGSPYFDISEPIELRIARDRPGDWELHVLLECELGNRPRDARLTLSGDGWSRTRPLRSNRHWDQYPFWLGEPVLSDGVELSAGAPLRLEVDGPDAGRFALGELKLIAQPIVIEPDLRRNVQGMSFMRSGHHMVAEFLQDYFGPAFIYCDIDAHCMTQPCVNPYVTFQKCHDPDGDIEPRDDVDYLIQYRHPLPSICSWFTWTVGTGEWPDASDHGWRRLADDCIEVWRSFIRKWVLDFDGPRAVKISYESLLADPADCCRELVRLFAPDRSVDEQRIARRLSRAPMQSRRALEQFVHYDREQFAALERRAAEEIEAVGLPLLLQ